MTTELEEVGRVLAKIGTAGSFATHRAITASDLKLEVRDVGRIRFPITPSTARRLCEVSRPARHGFKDQTRLDRRVRDTGEIPRSRISIDEPRWERALAPQLDRIRQDLGLPEGCRLTAQLHNMLIYAPGQFFVTHQDSEKTDHMIGTLVVNLPSRFTGGAMTIEHHGEKVVVGGSGGNLTLIAFYADCHHEVQAIKQGHRVVLTYNLMVRGSSTSGASPDQTAALARSLRNFFATPGAPRASDDRSQDPPDRLIYLLDHQYTQRGLAWGRLKNSDAARATALQAVAQQLNCEIQLALADVHETWACEDDVGYGSSWGWSRDEDEEQEDEPDSQSSDTATLTELIDSEVELRHWVGTGARPKAIFSGVRANELCYTKPSSELEPFESQHEGYMGNWGNTVDRWYHRAAVVIWPRERTFIIRAKASPRWAVAEVAKALKARHTAKALALAQRLLPFWSQATWRQDSDLLGATLAVTAKLGDANTAAALLQPFALTGVTPKMAPRVAELLESYGPAWLRTLLSEWTSEKKNNELPEARMAWIGSTPRALCRSLCARNSSDGRTLARQILGKQWTWVLGHLKQLGQFTAIKELSKELTRLCQPILALLDCSQITEDLDLQRQILGFLTSQTTATHMQLGVLRAAHARHRSITLRSLGLNPLHAHCSRTLTICLNSPVRTKDDWSIAASVRCSCELCATLKQYLHAQDKVRLEWPLAQAQRGHIHRIVDAHDLPVRHTTRRTGRPFTLVLEKTAAVFERAAAERQSWQKDLRWLMQTAEDF